MDTLLRKGAYGLLLGDEDDEAARVFCEADIEDLLAVSTGWGCTFPPTQPSPHALLVPCAAVAGCVQRNTHKVQVQSATTGFSVQKHAFAAEDADVQIDVTDPDFWQKVLPDNASPGRLLSRLNDRTATASVDSRNQFIEDVEEMVTGQLGELEKGRPVDQKDHDDACALLLQISQRQ